MYPKERKYTTVKRRTNTQAQWNKAEKTIEESKDKIMSTLNTKDSKIVLIDG